MYHNFIPLQEDKLCKLLNKKNDLIIIYYGKKWLVLISI